MQRLGLNQYSKEEIMEMSMIEVAYEILLEKKQAIPFKELLDEIARIQELTQEELNERISQFYTDLNIDGRFSSMGENRWGLKSWYPVDQIEDEVVHTIKLKKKKSKKILDDEDLDDFDVIEEDDIVDFDDLDEYDEDVLLEEDEEEDDVELLDDIVEEDDFEEEIIEEDEFELDDDSGLEEDADEFEDEE
ncbi:DNA-directed RNA polymerase subunit delta [Peribacillus tepidiphilus]|uniref:DNA-directed RNA polymerase subunit delta n=1 Tax=Peribacillus tepidiphilus TaxID=2652445 RepID=UPI0030B8463C